MTWRALLLGLVVVAACGDGLGPLRELRIASIHPLPFRAGEELEIRGPGLGHATVTLGGETLAVVQRRRDRAVVRAPASMPHCPGDTFQLVVTAGDLRDSAAVGSVGTPIPVELLIGEHVVHPEIERGCLVQLNIAGTYGVALYRTAPSAQLSESVRNTRLPATVTLGFSAPGAGLRAAPTPRAARAPQSVASHNTLSARRGPPTRSAAATQCGQQPAVAGGTVRIRSASDFVDHDVLSSTEHYAVIARPGLIEPGTALHDLAVRFASVLETRVQPFLDAVFESWPDADGNGQLLVLLREGQGAAYGGGMFYYEAPCIGDFIEFSPDLLANGFDATVNNPVTIVVHEAMHWYDLGYGATRHGGMPDWSVEGVAAFVDRLWTWSTTGRDFWANGGITCPPDATCTLEMLQEKRYGSPGLSLAGGYGHGSYIVQYLVQQALEHGASPLSVAGLLRHRRTSHGSPELKPTFEAIGGAGRSEAQLQGEYLLTFLADDAVPGVSSRVMNFSWNIPTTNPSYPLSHFTLTSGDPARTVELARPDGITFHVTANAGSVLEVEPLPGIAIAVIRIE